MILSGGHATANPVNKSGQEAIWAPGDVWRLNTVGYVLGTCFLMLCQKYILRIRLETLMSVDVSKLLVDSLSVAGFLLYLSGCRELVGDPELHSLLDL